VIYSIPSRQVQTVKNFGFFVLSVVLFTSTAFSNLQQSQTILQVSGVEAGFAVVLEPSSPQSPALYHNNQRILVHTLTCDNQKWQALRKAIDYKGLYGLISADAILNFNHLPYGDNQVNLLVIEEWETCKNNGLTYDEIFRVTAPFGSVALSSTDLSLAKGQSVSQKLQSAGFTDIQSSGSIVMAKKNATDGMDNWTHREYGPEGNALSHDEINPPKLLKWTSGNEEYGKDQHAGFRTDNGRVIYLKAIKDQKSVFVGRDIFSGAQLWTKPTDLTKIRQKAYVMDGDRFYCFLNENGDLVALDAATGNTLTTFTGLPVFKDVNNVELLIVNNVLVATSNGLLIAWDAQTGEEKWRFDSGKELQFISASQDENLVFAAIGTCEVRSKSRWRLFSYCLESIKAFHLNDGNEKWTNTDLVGKSLGQLVYYDGYLGFFSSSAISGGSYRTPTDDLIGTIEVSSGEILWQDRFNEKGTINNFGYNLIIRDGLMLVGRPNGMWRWDLLTGTQKSMWKVTKEGDYPETVRNQRCHRPVATNKFILNGYVTWVTNTWDYAFEPIRRSSCATPGFPTYNQLLFTPTECTCYEQLDNGRGYVSLANDNGEQLVTEDGYRFVPGEIKEISTGIKNPLRKSTQKSALSPESPIVQDWQEFTNNRTLVKTAVQPSAGENHTYTIDQVRNVVTIDHPQYGAQELWFSGRIITEPIQSGNLFVIGSTDGYVYTYDLSEQNLAWQFLAAPYDRRVLKSSRLESTWPLSNIALHDDTLIVSAGTNTSTAGGIFYYGLKVNDGSLLWKKREISYSGSLYKNLEEPIIEDIPIGSIPRLNETIQESSSPLNIVVTRSSHSVVISSKIKTKLPVSYRITDVAGKSISSGVVTNANSIEVPFKKFSKGMYLYTVKRGSITEKGSFLFF